MYSMYNLLGDIIRKHGLSFHHYADAIVQPLHI